MRANTLAGRQSRVIFKKANITRAKRGIKNRDADYKNEASLSLFSHLKNGTTMAIIKNLFQKVTKAQATEFGLAAILVAICFGLYYKQNNFIIAALLITTSTIIVPRVLFPFAVFWFGLAKILNAISSRIMMTLIFFILVVPVGLARKIFGKDSLKINEFKKGNQSVMADRNHLYTGADLVNTF